ncbi:hypothetical protein HN51_017528 [Arachis hypogaea]|uniref:ZCF37 n=1 Tax=Arachis hypogaea TaxID=3818 RepID=A0A445CXR7_ARAHY|nr:uncharacterized protein LOC112757893 [Arachis hypogaea]QHN88595.1 uncharacterized protein DS421_16g564790 [Arachis hypogaea]RYR55664.1 hypothetical protein Ahy_A06g030847 isoform C [Arachis hypogaea]
MLSHFGCGTFHHEADDELPCPTPRKSKTKKDNPFSTRGLDKFSALLADLDEKRQRIYSQMNPHEISFVRFVYSSTNDFVPIVVKVKNNNKSQELKVMKPRKLDHHHPHQSDKPTVESSEIVDESKQPKLENGDKKVKKKRLNWNLKSFDMWKPCFYVPMVMILILVLLTMFGRSVSTLCTCILWYVIPALKGSNRSSSNSRMLPKNSKKKDYARGVSETKKIVINEGLVNNEKKDYVRGFSEKKMVVNEEKVKIKKE